MICFRFINLLQIKQDSHGIYIVLFSRSQFLGPEPQCEEAEDPVNILVEESVVNLTLGQQEDTSFVQVQEWKECHVLLIQIMCKSWVKNQHKILRMRTKIINIWLTPSSCSSMFRSRPSG